MVELEVAGADLVEHARAQPEAKERRALRSTWTRANGRSRWCRSAAASCAGGADVVDPDPDLDVGHGARAGGRSFSGKDGWCHDGDEGVDKEGSR